MSDPNPANIPSRQSGGLKTLLIAALGLSVGALGLSVVALLFAIRALKGGAASPNFASVDRLKADMADPAADETIKRNLALADALRISGRPSFITGKEITRGLVDLDTMKRLIGSARQR